MSASWLLATILLVAQAEDAPTRAPAASTEAADADASLEVRKLVAQLDSPDKTQRDAAEQKLLDLGPSALEHLPKVTADTPAEVSLRLDRIRAQLQQAAADASVRATHVTLKNANLPLSKALAAIQRQTGNKLVDFRGRFGEHPADPMVHVDFDKTPFWQALDDVMDQAQLTIYDYSGEEGLALVNRPSTLTPRVGRADYEGAFRIEPTTLSAHRDLRNPAGQGLQIHLEVAWEPRLRPIVLVVPLSEIKLTDDQGKPFASDHPAGPLEIPVNRGETAIRLPLQFDLPPREIKKFGKVEGKFSALLPGRVETFRFGNLENARRVEQRQAGVTVVLDEVVQNDALWEFHVRVVFDKAAGALESHRNWVFNNPIWLEAPGKEKLSFAGFETTKQTENEVGVSYLFTVPDDLKAYTLVYQTATSIADIPVTFTLKDLELP